MDGNLLKLASANRVCELLHAIRRSKEAFEQMKTMLQLVKKKQLTDILMIDQLNEDKDLVKTMKSHPLGDQ